MDENRVDAGNGSGSNVGTLTDICLRYITLLLMTRGNDLMASFIPPLVLPLHSSFAAECLLQFQEDTNTDIERERERRQNAY